MWVFAAVCGLSPAAAGRGCSLGVVLGLLAAQASNCSDFSGCGAWDLWHAGSVAPSMWNLPRPGIEPMSPTLVGRLLTAEP